ncbi:hypothetical protein [Caulobacter sp.]|uniref:hypothetical protein n=1 Tax=Caulobacter sp. TaxID=78 RepID=UPI003BAE61F1
MTRMNLGRVRAAGVTLTAVLTLAGAAQAQMKPKYPISRAEPVAPAAEQKAPDPASENPEGWMTETRKKSVEIGAQPARDVGILKREIPPVLVKAQESPYGLEGLRTCKQLAAQIEALNTVLGPDYVAGPEVKENRGGKLAEAGGKAVVNSIIPFRGLVREVTGAALADRRMDAAVEAGVARRGFLRGVQAKQGCKTRF